MFRIKSELRWCVWAALFSQTERVNNNTVIYIDLFSRWIDFVRVNSSCTSAFQEIQAMVLKLFAGVSIEWWKEH